MAELCARLLQRAGIDPADTERRRAVTFRSTSRLQCSRCCSCFYDAISAGNKTSAPTGNHSRRLAGLVCSLCGGAFSFSFYPSNVTSSALWAFRTSFTSSITSKQIKYRHPCFTTPSVWWRPCPPCYPSPWRGASGRAPLPSCQHHGQGVPTAPPISIRGGRLTFSAGRLVSLVTPPGAVRRPPVRPHRGASAIRDSGGAARILGRVIPPRVTHPPLRVTPPTSGSSPAGYSFYPFSQRVTPPPFRVIPPPCEASLLPVGHPSSPWVIPSPRDTSLLPFGSSLLPCESSHPGGCGEGPHAQCPGHRRAI